MFLEIRAYKNYYSVVEVILDLKGCREIVISKDIRY